MKLSKLFKIALPILGVATIATTVPLALTSCSSQTDSSNNPSKPGQSQQQVQVLEPVDINSLPVPTHNFKNSFTQQPTEITSLATANKQLQEKWSAMSESEKTQTLQNDLQNWANTYNQYVYNNLPNCNPNNISGSYFPASMVQFQPITEETNNFLNNHYTLQNDPRGKQEMPSTYKYRNFQIFDISNIQYKNNLLSFTFTTNTIYQISDGTNVIAQINDCVTANYSNVSVQPIMAETPKNNEYGSSFMFLKGTLSSSETIKDIIPNNTTPFTDYFAKNVNKNFVTSNDPAQHALETKNGFKLYKPSTINFNFDSLFNTCSSCTTYPEFNPAPYPGEVNNSIPSLWYIFSNCPDICCSPSLYAPIGVISPTLNVLDTLNTTPSGSTATTQNK